MFCVALRIDSGFRGFTALTDWYCVTEMESVYCAVRTEFLHKTEKFRFKGLTERNSEKTNGKTNMPIAEKNV
jgi:hypothetical protein